MVPTRSVVLPAARGGIITGVMLAAVLLTWLPEQLRNFQQYRMIAYALLLIIMMLVRPQGLFGIHEIWDFWPKRKGRGARNEERAVTSDAKGGKANG